MCMPNNTMLTAATITNAQIRALRNEAEKAGDYAQVDICDRALAREIDGPQDQDGNQDELHQELHDRLEEAE